MMISIFRHKAAGYIDLAVRDRHKALLYDLSDLL